ncbi:ABC transporter ATP-binding protein/permease [Phormidium yuhuli AB48]|uniref:ABC transporter ATP-binding protein/permease n=1 Tax=Phormidium yuhuli AB48 TaxID=2940671 RepID=A0ABY5ATK0_9CYAN|nr:ABC transporter ATP-binding protein [Phormidium yuhuli]USR92183.1 ABC transporter ATP-binding protein/permease [Phormidium yuhuli AB48]
MTVTPLDRPKARPKTNDWRLFLRLVPYAKRNQNLLWIVLALLAPLALAGSIQPVLVGQTISFIRGEPTYFFLEGLTLSQGITLLVGLLFLTMVVRATLDGIQGFLVQKVGQRMTMQIRNDLFKRVTSLSSSFFDRTPVGRLITRLTSDVDALGDVFSTGAIGIVSDLATILVLILVMFTVQWELALMLLLMLIPTAAIVIYFQQQFRKANYRAREELSRLNSNFQENIVGINIVQLFRRERYNAEAFRSINQDYITAVDRTIFHDSAVSATLEWVSLVAIAGVLWLGGVRVLEGEMNFGLLASFVLFAQRLFDPLRQFAEKFTSLQSGFTAVERISDLLDEPIDIQDPAGIDTRSIEPGHSGEIRFETVSFGYKPDEYVLHNLNFTIHRGEKVAIVGPTGAGKSSMIRLLCRLYEPQQGRILIDGIDVRDLRQAELRQHVGVILQDGFVFAGDVKSNIALGEEYEFERIKAAAEQTNVSQFIEQLPDGYNTQLRERGTNLSGGQKQLLAFARVAVRDPKIMVLDEATANLDVKTEAWIQEALDRLLEKRTAIIIAHRLSTIRNVDRILVLKRGELVESGSHEELLQQNGLYASLYKLQLLES